MFKTQPRLCRRVWRETPNTPPGSLPLCVSLSRGRCPAYWPPLVGVIQTAFHKERKNHNKKQRPTNTARAAFVQQKPQVRMSQKGAAERQPTLLYTLLWRRLSGNKSSSLFCESRPRSPRSFLPSLSPTQTQVCCLLGDPNESQTS